MKTQQYLCRRHLIIAIFAAAYLLCSLPVNAAGLGKYRDGKGYGPEFSELGEKFSQAIQSGNLDLAENLARKRVELAIQIGSERRIGNAYRNLGNVLRLRGNLHEAESLIRKAQPMIDRGSGQQSHQAIRNLITLESLLTASSRLAEANTVAMEALERQLAYAPRGIDMLTIYNSLGKIQRLLGRYDAAESWLNKAVASDISPEPLDENDNNSGAYWFGKRRAETAFQQSYLELQRNRLDKADAFARQAINAFSAIEKENHPDLIASMVLRATILLREKRLNESEPILEKAIALAQQTLGPNHHETARAIYILAEVLDKQDRPKEAEPLFNRAVKVVKHGGYWDMFAHFGQGYARFLSRHNRPLDAMAIEREVLDATDQLFAQTRGLDEAAREDFIAQFGSYYLEAVELLLELHQSRPKEGYDKEALSVVSRTQSRIFTELLKEADVSEIAKNSEFADLRNHQEKLNKKLDELRRAKSLSVRKNYQDENEDANGVSAINVDDPIVSARIEAGRAKLEAEIADVTKELVSVEASLWDKYPRYMELAQPRPITVEILQRKLLKPGESLLTYFLLPKTTLAFVVTRDDFHMVKMPIGRADIAAMVAAARAPEESVGSGGFAGLSKLDPTLLNKLYAGIFQPVEMHLRNAQRLLVIVDGPLNTLPLEMLVTRYGETEKRKFEAARANGKTALAEYGTLPYLGEQYRFAYLPSLSALASVRLYRKPQVKYDRDLVSFADPVFDQEQSTSPILNALTRGMRRGGTVSIPRLPETADEAKEIARIVGGRSEIFLREKAQEHTAKTLDLRNTKYIHFATHGLLAGEFTELKEAYSAAESQADENSRERRLVLVKSSPLLNDDLGIIPANADLSSKGEPALLLSLSGDMQGEDGLLTMREIISTMDLNAKLVVLSACNTAGERTEANNGEGFAGLTRAFMYAGAQGLLVSHWSVESQATQNLMTETFRNMQTQQDSLQAVDNARSNMRNSVVQLNGHPVSRSHPYFWAPFVYVGE